MSIRSDADEGQSAESVKLPAHRPELPSNDLLFHIVPLPAWPAWPAWPAYPAYPRISGTGHAPVKAIKGGNLG
jgi:hypothetical protein